MGFERCVKMDDGAILSWHEIVAFDHVIGVFTEIEILSYTDSTKPDDGNRRATRIHLDYIDGLTEEAGYDIVKEDERFVEYVDPNKDALDQLLPTLTDEQADIIPQIFPVWALDVHYTAGQRCRYNDILYRCIQEHTSLEGYEPPNVPALWTRNGASGGIEEWIQPTGSEDAYNTGDKVTHNGKTWESNCDGNVWEPGVYGWDEIE